MKKILIVGATGFIGRNLYSDKGFKAVKLETLYGSHSAELRISYLDQNGILVQQEEVFSMQAYDVLWNFMGDMDELASRNGGSRVHEHVEWGYSMAY